MQKVIARSAWALLGLVLVTAGTAEEAPPAKPPVALPAGDPLLKEIEQLRGEMEQLRRELRGIAPTSTLAPVKTAKRGAAWTNPVGSTSSVSPPQDTYDLWSFQPLAAPAVPTVKDG